MMGEGGGAGGSDGGGAAPKQTKRSAASSPTVGWSPNMYEKDAPPHGTSVGTLLLALTCCVAMAVPALAAKRNHELVLLTVVRSSQLPVELPKAPPLSQTAF